MQLKKNTYDNAIYKKCNSFIISILMEILKVHYNVFVAISSTGFWV